MNEINVMFVFIKLTGSEIPYTRFFLPLLLLLYISLLPILYSHIFEIFFPSKMGYYEKVLMKMIFLFLILLSMNMATARVPLWISDPHKPSKSPTIKLLIFQTTIFAFIKSMNLNSFFSSTFPSKMKMLEIKNKNIFKRNAKNYLYLKL